MGMQDETRAVRFEYPLAQVRVPILYHLIIDYGLIPNVYRANIDVHMGGFLEMELTGEPTALDRALVWVGEHGVRVTDPVTS
jgi:hypothetical protein